MHASEHAHGADGKAASLWLDVVPFLNKTSHWTDDRDNLDTFHLTCAGAGKHTKSTDRNTATIHLPQRPPKTVDVP